MPQISFIAEKSDTRPIFPSVPQDAAFFDELFLNITPRPVKAASAVVPHHLVAGKHLAQLFMDMQGQQPELVIVLSPNHFNIGRSPIYVGDGRWQTPYGLLGAATPVVNAYLNDFPERRGGEALWEKEHGIGALTPLIKRTWPQAEILPVVMEESVTEQERERLAAWLAANYPEALVLASVDMVHESPERVAKSHDEVTAEYLARNCQPENFTPAADAPWVLDTLCKINALRGTEAFTLHARTSSVSLGLATRAIDNTSHLMGTYTFGPAAQEPYAAFHTVGDIMLDRGTRRAIDSAGTANYPWQRVNWLLTGTHLRVGNLEGTVNERPSKYTDNPPFEFVFHPSFVEAMKPHIDLVSLANNHTYDVGRTGQEETMRRLSDMSIPYFGSFLSPLPVWTSEIGGVPVAFIGYHQFQPAMEELALVIAEQKTAGRVVVVMPHWGNEYIVAPQENQRALARRMVAAGADMILGGHPHVAQGIEIIDGVPVFYSLGNFVFDQRIPETWTGLTVTTQIFPDRFRFHLLPVGTRYSQPVALEEGAAATVLRNLSKVSSESIRESVQSGILEVPRNTVQ